MSAYRTFLTLTVLLSPACLYAQAITDGTMGASQTLSGHFTVPASLGTLSGSNLFHSFKTFNINSGESATFTGPSSILNVISRVTGGEASSLNGPLRSEVGGANFYLINPAGVVFGPEASLDVPAAFHVGAADSLHFAAGNNYTMTTPVNSLSVSAPERFGLTSPSLANNGLLRVSGATLQVSNKQALTLTGQTMTIDHAQLTANEGDITLTGTNIDIVAAHLTTDTHSAANAGNIDISAQALVLANTTQLSASSHAAGSGGVVNLHANTVTLDGKNTDAFTGIVANTYDVGQAGKVNVEATSLTIQGGAQMNSSTFGAGDANAVTVVTKALTIDGNGNAFGATGIGSRANVGSSGQAGNVSVTADTIALINGGSMSTATSGTGNAGTVAVNAGTLRIDGQNNLAISTGIDSSTNASATGHAGLVNVKAYDLWMANAGAIGSNSFGQGNAGSVQVQADAIDINGHGSDQSAFTGISSSTQGNGHAGNVTVVANTLNLFESGRIASNTTGDGNAGDVRVVANKITIDGNNSAIYTGIASNTYEGKGNAGTVNVVADALTINNAGRITTNTRGMGSAGDLIIEANTLDIDAKNSDYLAGIASAASPESTGQVGNIHIVASHHLTLLNQAQISIQNRGTVLDTALNQFGQIELTTPYLSLANQSLINAQSTQNADASTMYLHIGHTLAMRDSSISTQANAGNGGAIYLDAGNDMDLQRSSITTSVASSLGNGGNITLFSPALILDNGMVQANAYSGHGGDVFIEVASLIGSQSQLIQGGEVPLTWKNTVPGFNIIQAASKFGLSGTVKVSSPQLDLSGVLIGLNTSAFGRDLLNHDYCAAGAGSSMTVRGFGALPLKAADLLY